MDVLEEKQEKVMENLQVNDSMYQPIFIQEPLIFQPFFFSKIS